MIRWCRSISLTPAAIGVLVFLAACRPAAPPPSPSTASASVAPAEGVQVTGTGYTFRLPVDWGPNRSSVLAPGSGGGPAPEVVVAQPGDGDTLMVSVEPASTVDEHPSSPSPGVVDQEALLSDDPFTLAGEAGRAVTVSYSVGATRLVSREITCVHNGFRYTVDITTDGLDAGPGLAAFDAILASWAWT